MSAVSRLLRRAPAWRFFLYASVLFLILGVLFPTPIVARHMAWTDILARYLPSWASPSPNAQDSTASNDNANPSQTDTGNPKGDLTDPARFITPDITLAMTGVIPFGGHSLPLPAGIWHPVLSGQYGPNARMSLNVLARTDRGIVTGVIIASTTDQDVPRDVVEDAYNHCHDDRNYHSTVLADRPDGKTECTYLTAAYMGPNASISSDPLIQLAFKRLVTLGFPMPSLFIVASWLHSSGAQESTKGSSSITYLLAPIQPGTVVLKAPLPYWNKNMIARAPAALEFLRRVDIWFTDWVPTLRRGMLNDYSSALADRKPARDPAAPEE